MRSAAAAGFLMETSDTVAAIATPAGEGGIGIVRLSGPQAVEVARKVFVPAGCPAGVEPRRLYFGRMVDCETGEELDRGFGVFMRAPRSYTGEDVFELHCHGGRLNVSQVLRSAIKAGARAAEAGEFTRRAVLNGRLDLVQAEAVCGVITAESEASLRAARRELAGNLSASLRGVKGAVTGILAEIEAAIDFPEEASPADLDEILRRLRPVMEAVEAIGKRCEKGARIDSLPRAVIAGKPNVGKSSLFNALLGTRRSIVSASPHTTRDAVEAELDGGGTKVRLVDLAGVGDPAAEIEREGMAVADEWIGKADFVLAVMDASAPPDSDDARVLKMAAGKRCVLVLNKTDLGCAVESADFAARAAYLRSFRVSARTGDGVPELAKAVGELARDGAEDLQDALSGNPRHERLIREARDALARAGQGLSEGRHEEIVAADLREAADRVDDVLGENTGEEVLDEIFSRFCIGK